MIFGKNRYYLIGSRDCSYYKGKLIQPYRNDYDNIGIKIKPKPK